MDKRKISHNFCDYFFIVKIVSKGQNYFRDERFYKYGFFFGDFFGLFSSLGSLGTTAASCVAMVLVASLTSWMVALPTISPVTSDSALDSASSRTLPIFGYPKIVGFVASAFGINCSRQFFTPSVSLLLAAAWVHRIGGINAPSCGEALGIFCLSFSIDVTSES